MKKYIFHPDGNGKTPTRFSPKYVGVIRAFRKLLLGRKTSYASKSEMYRDIECLAFPHLNNYIRTTPIYTTQQFSRVVEVALNLGWITIEERAGKKIPVQINHLATRENPFIPSEYISYAKGLSNTSVPEIHKTCVAAGTKIAATKTQSLPEKPQINNLTAQSDPAYTYCSTITSSLGFSGYSYK